MNGKPPDPIEHPEAFQQWLASAVWGMQSALAALPCEKCQKSVESNRERIERNHTRIVVLAFGLGLVASGLGFKLAGFIG